MHQQRGIMINDYVLVLDFLEVPPRVLIMFTITVFLLLRCPCLPSALHTFLFAMQPKL